MTKIRKWPYFFFGIAFLAFSSFSESVSAPHVKVALVSEHSALFAAQTNWVGILFEIEKDWHLYWKNPGDSGEAARITWQVPPGVSVGPIQWPTPKAIPIGPLMNYGYSDLLLLMVPFEFKEPSGQNDLAITAKVKWLICKVDCIPGEATLSLTLPQSSKAPQRSEFASYFEDTRSKLPQVLAKENEPTFRSESSELVLEWKRSPFKPDAKLFVFPEEQNQIENAAPQKLTIKESALELRLLKAVQTTKPLASFKGLLVVDGKGFAFDVPAAPATGSGFDFILLLQALLFAFMGGLILNLMPCVFPVLAIKGIHLLKHVNESSPKITRFNALFYVLGVLVSFWLLVLVILLFRLGGETLGWGFQLQSAWFVAVIADVLFVMALNLLGVFEFGASFSGFGSKLASRRGYEGSFFTGMLATLVATPCTAPFMGTALAYGLGQTSLQAFLVFTALGLGLAAPFALISLVPGLAKLLPKPGQWMKTFKELMAFPILATVIWLSYVFAVQTSSLSMTFLLLGFLLLALAAWSFSRSRRGFTKIFALLVLAFAIYIQIPAGKMVDASRWQVFSVAKLEELKSAGHPVFIDFTAAWCVTCKVNEMVALTDAVMNEMQAKGVVPLRADWTNADPEITKTLESFGRNGVPLYILYNGIRGESPLMLPQILTPKIVLEALEKVKKGGSR